MVEPIYEYFKIVSTQHSVLFINVIYIRWYCLPFFISFVPEYKKTRKRYFIPQVRLEQFAVVQRGRNTSPTAATTLLYVS